MKVFGIGFSKTGTTSLEEALSLLDFNVCKGHYNNNYTNYLLSLYVNKDYKELIKMTQYWDAFADGPWGGTRLFKVLTKHYPNAYFIHTIRDPDIWYSSLERMFLKFSDNLETAFDNFHKNGRYGSIYFFGHIFEIESLVNQKDNIISYYNSLNQEIVEFYSNSSYNYLKIDITKEPNWNKLCEFLEKDIPNHDFPHLNSSSRVIGKEEIPTQKQSWIRKRFKI
jgi:Sulfotransferase domain